MLEKNREVIMSFKIKVKPRVQVMIDGSFKIDQYIGSVTLESGRENKLEVKGVFKDCEQAVEYFYLMIDTYEKLVNSWVFQYQNKKFKCGSGCAIKTYHFYRC